MSGLRAMVRVCVVATVLVPVALRAQPPVFKNGIGYDSAKLFASVQGRVGLH